MERGEKEVNTKEEKWEWWSIRKGEFVQVTRRFSVKGGVGHRLPVWAALLPRLSALESHWLSAEPGTRRPGFESQLHDLPAVRAWAK